MVLPVSPALAIGIQSFAPRANLHVVPNIVTHCDYQPVEKRPSTSICVVADIVFSIKQQDTIIEVFSELPQMQFELHFLRRRTGRIEAHRTHKAALEYVFSWAKI